MNRKSAINFNGEMVRALLDGRKTQTRRVVKPQPQSTFVECDLRPVHIDGRDGWGWYFFNSEHPEEGSQIYGCPYGIQGNRLLVASPLPGIPVITLEILNVRVERVQDISEEDAVAEGVKNLKGANPAYSCKRSFRAVWDSIYSTPYTWAKNPWVFVLEFKKV